MNDAEESIINDLELLIKSQEEVSDDFLFSLNELVKDL